MSEHAGLDSVDRADHAGDWPVVVLSALCGGGTCPTIYRTSKGTILVQGASVDPTDVGLALADGELLVEIPEQLLSAVAQALRNQKPSA